MSLSELCVRRPVFATMLVMSLVVLGIFSFRDLSVDLFPKADPATVNVSIQLPGASPDEVATAAVQPLENALSGIAGIDQLTASIAEGSANITVRFLLDTDLNDAANSVREKVAGAMRNVPPQVLPPVIQKADPDADPIMTLVLSSRTMSLRALTEIADKQVRRAIETTSAILKYGMGRSGIELCVNMPDDLPEVACSQSDLEQVFLNLLTNAREATPHGGRIMVSVQSTERVVQISIADSGCGIPAENLPKVLEPFFTTKPHGNGLGLSICRSVLWEVDGTLTIQSEPSNGTCVYVGIPRAVPQPHAQCS